MSESKPKDPNEFKKVGVALDNYKVKRYRTVLKENGYETKLGKGVTPDTAMLYIKDVHQDQIPELQKILVRLENENRHRN